MVDLSHSYRMSVNSFEKSFMPEFKAFVFQKAIQVATDMMARQDDYAVRLRIAKTFSDNQMIDKKERLKLRDFIQKNIRKVSIECTVDKMKEISKNPDQFQTPCTDASLSIWLHNGKMYVAAHNIFINDFKKPQHCEIFNFSKESDDHNNWQRKPTWEKVLAESCPMIMQVINANQGIGTDAIQKLIEAKHLEPSTAA